MILWSFLIHYGCRDQVVKWKVKNLWIHLSVPFLTNVLNMVILFSGLMTNIIHSSQCLVTNWCRPLGTRGTEGVTVPTQYFEPWCLYCDWWTLIGIYVIGATFQSCSLRAGLRFGRDAMFFILPNSPWFRIFGGKK